MGGAYERCESEDQWRGGSRRSGGQRGGFDNYTTKETRKSGQRDSCVGYVQWGRKQKRNRGLSTTVSPEAAQPQDSVSWVYKAEHQRGWSNPLFSEIHVNLIGYDFPLGVTDD